MGIKDILALDLVDKPEKEAIEHCNELLTELRAIDQEVKLTVGIAYEGIGESDREGKRNGDFTIGSRVQ
jgi:hypothetical protein